MYRKLFRRFFSPGAEKQYWSLEENEALVTTAQILKDPSAFVLHLKRNAAAIIMKIGFGYNVAPEDDHFVKLAEENIRIITTANRPGAWLVDAIPILRFIPSWFPGARFKRLANEWSEATHKMAMEPHDFVKQQIREGVAEPSFTSQLLRNEDGSFVNAEMEDVVFWAAGALYTAGTDTTVAALEAFMYLMMTHPDIQSRAQQEIDGLIAQINRLPTLEDRPVLPFLGNILKEVLRWSCVAPFGIPHSNSKEDIYYVGDRGYRIPKGSIVFANLWNMAFDPAVYPDPFTFDPNRYGGAFPQQDPRKIVFGFGKRICAGQNIAESTMFIQMATILATARIEVHQDDLGKELKPTFTSAAVRHLTPFKCRIVARSHQELVRLDQLS